MRLWIGLFFSPREWLFRPLFFAQSGDLFFDFLFLRLHIAWNALVRDRSSGTQHRWR